jgi:hypothetical protein
MMGQVLADMVQLEGLQGQDFDLVTFLQDGMNDEADSQESRNRSVEVVLKGSAGSKELVEPDGAQEEGEGYRTRTRPACTSVRARRAVS